MADDYITAGEFTRWRAEETEFRVTLNRRLDELLQLVRVQNGRVVNHEKQVAIVERRLMAIEQEDRNIEQAVMSIQRDGCRQYKLHEQLLTVFNGSGVPPPPDGPARAFSVRDWTTKQKAAAGVGVGALFIPAVSDLVQLGVAVVNWVHHLADTWP